MKVRKYSTKEIPAIGEAIDWLVKHKDFLNEHGLITEADECLVQADSLYDYLARSTRRKGKISDDEKAKRNMSILLRSYQKRIAELEEKLLIIRTSTDLWDRGVATSSLGGGERMRMKRRIDHLEAKLLIIRGLTDTREGKPNNADISEYERQVRESRIRVDIKKALAGNGKAAVVHTEKLKILNKELTNG